MKSKLAPHGPLILFCLHLLPPLCYLLAERFGYRIEVRSWFLHAALFAAASILFTWLSVKHAADTPWTSAVSAALLPAASVIHSAMLLLLSSDTGSAWTAPFSALLYCVCAWILLVRCSRLKVLTVVSSIVSAALCLALAYFGFIARVFGSIGERSVVQTVCSPGYRYAAEVVDVNQGALGGASLVEVSRLSGTADLLLYRIVPAPETIYRGPWGEAFDMRVEWQDEQTIQINGVKHSIENK